MSLGLAALLDDVALIAKTAAASIDDIGAAAAKTSMKAAGVVVDDAAVTPRYVQGVTPARELPIIWRIAKGSLINKLVFILPLALILSALLPWVLTPILMLGGLYLCFEGAEKIIEKFTGTTHEDPVITQGAEAEDKLVSAAIRTDLILSAEIMVISLNEVANQPLLNRTLILIVVGVLITALVYGAVGLLVKMDDIGRKLQESSASLIASLGRGMVLAMPRVLSAIAIIGVFAMLWVGGHILLAGADTLGWHAPYALVHHLSHMVHNPALIWIIETGCSMIAGIIVGTLVVMILHVLPLNKKNHS